MTNTCVLSVAALIYLCIHIVYFRDVTEGTFFQLYCKDKRKTLQLFLMKDCRWVGLTICIYVPEFEFTIAGMPALSPDQPLLHLHNECVPSKQSPYVAEWATTAYTKALYVQNADLRLFGWMWWMRVERQCATDSTMSLNAAAPWPRAHRTNSRYVAQCPPAELASEKRDSSLQPGQLFWWKKSVRRYF